MMLSQLNTLISQASYLYLVLGCLNNTHKINTLSYVFLQNTEIYPVNPQAAVFHSASPCGIQMPSGEYVSVFSQKA